MLEPEYTFGTTTIYCDRKGCDNQVYHEGFDNHSDIIDACKEAGQNGWIIIKENDEYYHYCSKECKEEDE